MAAAQKTCVDGAILQDQWLTLGTAHSALHILLNAAPRRDAVALGGQLLWASEMLYESLEREVAEPRGTVSRAKLEVRNLIPIDDSIWRHPTRIRATGLGLFDELAVQIIEGLRITHLADVINPPELPPIKRLLRFREVSCQAF